MVSLGKPKAVIVVGIIAFLVMSFWGLSSMPMDEHGKMANCPFMNGSTALCPMSVTEHITQWQQFFTLVPRDESSLFSVFSFIVLFVILIFSLTKTYHTNVLPLSKFRFHSSRYKPEITLFNYLLVVFSQGILNPRIYV